MADYSDRKSNVPDYSLSESQLIQRLLNPRPGKNGIPALPSEVYVEDGVEYIDQQAYIDRVLATPKYSHLKNKIKSFEPAREPGAGSIVWTNLKQTPGLIRDATVVGSDVVLSEMMGINENPSLDYISQQEYKDRIAAGQTPKDIWPHLADSSNRTWGDWFMWSISPVPGHIGLDFWNDYDGTAGKIAKYDLPETLLPEASQRLEYRAKHYEKGGEVSEDGYWIEPDGSVSDVNNRWTPVEWNTRENYEKRKESTTDWDGGFVKQVKQNIFFEWFDPNVDKAMMYIMHQRQNAANDPAMQELQKWSHSVDWKDAWSEGVLGKKILNAVSGALPSYGTGIALGGITLAATKNPALAANISGIAMAGLDSSDMYLETLEWAKRNGYSDQEAEAMAAEYYTYYAVASFAWERLPFSKVFRRTKNLPQRKQIIKETHDKWYKRAMFTLKEELLNAGTVSRSKVRAVFTQGTAEALTELGQYVTQTALQADYKEETFSELWDVNAALDAVVGGFGMGGITGGFGGAEIDDTKGIGLGKEKLTKEERVKKEAEELRRKAQNIVNEEDDKGASPETTYPPGPTKSVPNTIEEYVERIVDQDINTTPLNPGLVTQILQDKMPKTELTEMIVKHQRSEYENYPTRKLADIVEVVGWGPIDNSKLTDEQKIQYKEKIAQELKSQKKKPLQNKQSLTPDEKQTLDSIDNLDTDSIINAIDEGKSIDSLIGKKIDKSIDESIDEDVQKKIDKQIEAGTAGGGIAITPEMKAKAEAEGNIEQVGEKVEPDSIPEGEGIDLSKGIPKGAKVEKAESITLTEQEEKAKTIAEYKKEYSRKTPKQLQQIKRSLSKPTSMTNPELRENVLAAIDEIIEDRKQAKKERLDKKKKRVSPEIQKRVDERIAKQEKEFKDKEELELRKKVTEERGVAILRMPLKKLKKHIEKLRTFEDKESKIELELALEELAEMEADKKARIEKKQKENLIEQPKSIALGSDADSEVNDILSEIGESDVNDIGRSSETLTTEESDAVKEQVEDRKEEIEESLCLNKGKGK